MSAVTELLRADLLAGRVIALAGGERSVTGLALGGSEAGGLGGGDSGAAGLGGGDSGAAGLGEALGQLGASVVSVDAELSEDWAREHAPIDVLVYNAARAFGEGGEDGLRAALEQAWAAIHAVAAGALIPGNRGGKVILIGPRAGAGAHGDAARAGLENLARTLSVEWARYRITVTMIAPGATTTAEELETSVAFLASVAGDYFTGCRFELGSV